MTLRGAPPPGTPAPGLPDAPSRAVADEWPELLQTALENRAGLTVGASRVLRILFQPIVDIERGTVIGYEALSRFSPVQRHPDLTTEHWFEAAHVHGVGQELEALALQAALLRRDDLPPKCFLSVNLSPDVVAHPAVRAILANAGDLTNVVIELTEHSRIDSFPAIDPILESYRTAGARIAMDDAGAGYAGLHNMVMLKPSIIKLDRSLIMGIDLDETRRALVETVATFAERINARLLGEGVERMAELDTLRELGVPLAQGYLLSRPAPRWTGIAEPVADRIRPPRRTPNRVLGTDRLVGGGSIADGSLRSLVETVPIVGTPEHAKALLGLDAALDLVVLAGYDRRPSAFVTPEAASLGFYRPALAMKVSTTLNEAARRAMTREQTARFDPIICTDDGGRIVGIARLDRIIDSLARSSRSR